MIYSQNFCIYTSLNEFGFHRTCGVYVHIQTRKLYSDKSRYGRFEVTNMVFIIISKTQHEFAVQIRIISAMSPVLDGVDVQPYVRIQQEFTEVIQEHYIHQLSYKKLDYADMTEAVLDRPNLNGKRHIFGPQVTVEDLLFSDYMELFEDD